MQRQSHQPSSMQLTGRCVALPNEIWHESFSYLSTADHKSLSLACRLFNDICLRFVFKSIHYSFCISRYQWDNPVEASLDRLEKTIKGLGSLAQSKRHAPLVREFNLAYSVRLTPRKDEENFDRAKTSYGLFVDAFVKHLPLFTNLQIVTIKEFQAKLDKKILVAIAKHPSLDEVRLSSVRFGVHILKPRIGVRKLTISNSPWGEYNPNPASKRLDMFSGDSLEYLSVCTPVYGPKLFRALSKQGRLDRLKQLYCCIFPGDISDLYVFLASCPNVDSVRIEFTDGRDHFGPYTFPPMPQTLLPRLKSFCGSEEAARHFVPGRPVDDVKIVVDSMDTLSHGSFIKIVVSMDTLSHGSFMCNRQPLFDSLALSTAPLRQLDVCSLGCRKEVIDSIVTHFPGLYTLKFCIPNVAKIFPNEDPRNLALETAQESSQDDAFLRETKKEAQDTGYFSKYLTGHLKFLHWAAHRKLALPHEIQTLELLDRTWHPSGTFELVTLDDEGDFYSNNCNARILDPDTYSDIATIASKKLTSTRKQYSIVMASDVMHALSLSYPALQMVVLRENSDRIYMRWLKDATQNWSYTKF